MRPRAGAGRHSSPACGVGPRIGSAGVCCQSNTWPGHSMGNRTVPNSTHTQVGYTGINGRRESQNRGSPLELGGERTLMRLEDSCPASLAVAPVLMAPWPNSCEATSDPIPTSIQPTPCGTHTLHDPRELHACVSPSP
ncbi:hypothetical protein HJG60_010460 [Phyllostomus discolor]|uniref:Uncharacterized protein n=1 Tax=Phyllostomus discolor TaxID=89673 RepID=A0A834EES6_9CHIR|nr:hypothetical protein HJG60_010460 [Phyllostomus discolor]